MVAKSKQFAPLVCAVLILQLICLSCANIPARLEQAGTLMKNVQYEQAEAIYKQIVTDYPGTDYALTAQKRLVMLYTSVKRDNDAQAAIEKLLTDFSGHEDIPKVVKKIADRYVRLNKYKKANQLYQHVLDNWPDSEESIWSQTGVVLFYIALADEPAAEAAVEKLLSNFSQDKRLPKVLSRIANRYRKLEDYEKALQLHRYVLDNFPQSEQAISLQRDTVFCYIALADEAAAEAAVEKLLSNFSQDKQLPKVLSYIAKRYRKLEDYEKAIQLYQYVIDNHAEDDFAILSRAGIARINVSVGDDDAAEAVLDKLIADFADHPGLPRAIRTIEVGYYMRILAAESRVRENYLRPVEMWEKVLSKFPNFFHDDPDLYYFIACCYYQLGQYEKAIEYCNIVINNWPDHKYGRRDARYLIDNSLDKLGQSRR